MKNYNPILSIFKIILTFCILTFYVGCGTEDSTVDCMPRSNVNASYSLNLPQFVNLNIDQRYVVLDADGTNGSRGIILFNTGSQIRAYDRNAPHICPTANSTLVVVDDIIIECPEDGAQWMLRSGEPLNTQTNGRSPRQLYVERVGNDIFITSN
ncbi:hypothetical protein GO491_01900 [Flavobacteriaceae bacterium Ap0902]|nr:hypothetical protein [Flavobacteriaceae bacterium Ap0902]